MKIIISCVGKLKEKYWTEAIAEYTKRMKRFSNIEMFEAAEEPCEDNPSEATILKVKEKEGKRLLQRVPDNSFCIAMDLRGKQIGSEELADKISDITIGGKSVITFLIGGSYGLSKECEDRADFKLSMSKMTFPHQMARVILLEQVYRAMKINANETYHK